MPGILMITARHIAEFIESLEQEEATQAQLLKAAEGKQVVALINDAPLVEPPVEPTDFDPYETQPHDEAVTDEDEPLVPLADYRV